jgi:hypothetical protein
MLPSAGPLALQTRLKSPLGIPSRDAPITHRKTSKNDAKWLIPLSFSAAETEKVIFIYTFGRAEQETNPITTSAP